MAKVAFPFTLRKIMPFEVLIFDFFLAFACETFCIQSNAGSICKDDTRSAMLLCGSCLELKEPQAKFSEAAKPSVGAKLLVAANDCFE
jgi:hypothetical protein